MLLSYDNQTLLGLGVFSAKLQNEPPRQFRTEEYSSYYKYCKSMSINFWDQFFPVPNYNVFNEEAFFKMNSRYFKGNYLKKI